MVNASDCGSEDRGFESHHSPHTKDAFPGATGRGRRSNNWTGFRLPCRTILGCRQAVRHQTLTLAFAGSSPAIPATSSKYASHGSKMAKACGSRHFLGCASRLLLFPTRPASLGSRGGPGERARLSPPPPRTGLRRGPRGKAILSPDFSGASRGTKMNMIR